MVVEVSPCTMATSLGCTRFTSASMASGSNTVPHSVSMAVTSPPQRAAISCSRWPKRPKIGTSTRSPGSIRETRMASMPARAVPSIRNDQRLEVWYSWRSSAMVSFM